MAKSQSRKSISISGETYQRLAIHCKACGSSVSGLVETLVQDFFRKKDAAKEEDVEEEERKEREPPATPFTLKIKKELPEPAKKEPVRGGGIHSL